jgi:hypothetical protein
MSKHCEGCGNKTTASGQLCRTCQSHHFHARKRVADEKLLVDTAGGSWWVWDPKGEVLVIGKATKLAALLTLHRGEDEPEEIDS